MTSLTDEDLFLSDIVIRLVLKASINWETLFRYWFLEKLFLQRRSTYTSTMEYVAVIAILACFTYSVYSQVPSFPQVPEIEVMKCIEEKSQKCKTICDNRFKKFENGTVDQTRINCHETSLCADCNTNKAGVDACGPTGKVVIEQAIKTLKTMLETNCTELILTTPVDTTSVDPPTKPDAQKCVDRLQASCKKACDLIYMKNGKIDSTKNHCCEISRCVCCINKKVGFDACDESAKQILQKRLADMELFFNSNCTESQRYPSAKCTYYFYTAWFYVVPLLILAVVGESSLWLSRNDDHK